MEVEVPQAVAACTRTLVTGKPTLFRDEQGRVFLVETRDPPSNQIISKES